MKAKQPEAKPERHEVRIGRLGGIATAAKMTQAERDQRASSGGSTTLKRYGVGYYSDLAKAAIKARKKNAAR